MAIRKIVELGDDKLRKHAKPVEKYDRRLKTLLNDMAETMYKADGVGLAAPQVGILRRAVVVDVGEGLYQIINPVIVESDGEQEGPEGCLSVPGRSGVVIRPNHVIVEGFDPEGNPLRIEGSEFFARALCHELDHLDGIIYVDKMVREIFPDEENEEGEEQEQ